MAPLRRWFAAAAGAAGLVGVRPDLWLPGALAWIATIGWIPFIVAVARPPTDAELTFLGARIVTSGWFPWNAVAIATAGVAIALGSFVVAASSGAALVARLSGRRADAGVARRWLAATLVGAVPAAVLVLAVLLAAAIIAPREFNAPDASGPPVARTLLRIAPLLVALGVAVIVGAAFAAVAGRTGGVRAGAVSLPAMGWAGWLQAVVGGALELAFVVFAALLLGVLWAPIDVQLAGGEIGLAGSALLVGFVAIWLCLVLAGGAIRAWSAATWSALLATRRPARGPLAEDAP